jgi:hypothetical protein
MIEPRRKGVEGATSLAQRSIFARCFDSPRGQRRSTKIREPSLGEDGSYARLRNMDMRLHAAA